MKLPAPLHVGRPAIGNRRRFFERLEQIFDNAWLTNNGPFVQEFEQRLAERLRVKHCMVVNNGTVGLELAIRATAMRGEVIVPSFTFIATVHALQWQEIQPVFCDIDPVTYCLDPAKVISLVNERTSGIIGVHVYGRPCDVAALEKIASDHELRLIFDAAHAFGCTYRQKPLGNFGDCEVFSFHATKVLNAFEGGAITTNSDDLAQKIRLMRNFGFAGEDNVIYLGTNGKMCEVSAAMGLTNLEDFELFVRTNQNNWEAYARGLHGIPGIRLITYDEAEQNNFHYVIIEVDSRFCGITRDELKNVLSQHNVLARRYFYPGCHRMEPYRTLMPDAGRNLTVTEAFCERVLALPNGSQLNAEGIETICGLIRDAIVT